MPLFNRSGWFGRLQEQAYQPYPEELVQAIVAKNHPILRDGIFSWLHQLETAVQSNDFVVVNQKLANLLASYFDIVFAVNHMTYPREKRLLTLAVDCEKTPPEMAKQVWALLQTAYSPDNQILHPATELLNDLDQLLFTEGFLQPSVRN